MMRQSARLLIILFIATLLSDSAVAQMPKEKRDALAASMASKLAAVCPRAAPNDSTAHADCTKALRAMTDLPLAESIAWGGAQPHLRLAKKQLTNFHGEIFRALYLSLFWFDGTWSVSHDARDDVDVIRLGAFFRNELPPGEFPYPFWHSDAKWSDYEKNNQLSFYVDPSGHVFAGTRGSDGDETARGYTMVHQPGPSFDGKWQWTDADGHLQPKASLFSNKYSADNPYLAPLDDTYRSFALGMRQGTCLRCHTPSNKAGMDRLVLLQTPAHAAAAINDVLKAVRNNDMPQNDWGTKSPLDDQLRTTLLTAGEAFSKLLAEADQWEAKARQAKPQP